MKVDMNEVPILTVLKGCRHCKAARNILNKQNVFYMEQLAVIDEVNHDDLFPILTVGEYEYRGVGGVLKYLYGRRKWLEESKGE